MTGWLTDTSAVVRLAAGPNAEEWAACIQRRPVRVHIDTDYDLIAGITGQPVERLSQT